MSTRHVGAFVNQHLVYHKEEDVNGHRRQFVGDAALAISWQLGRNHSRIVFCNYGELVVIFTWLGRRHQYRRRERYGGNRKRIWIGRGDLDRPERHHLVFSRQLGGGSPVRTARRQRRHAERAHTLESGDG